MEHVLEWSMLAQGLPGRLRVTACSFCRTCAGSVLQGVGGTVPGSNYLSPVPRSIPCCLPLQTDIDMHISGQVGVQYEQGISCDSKAEHGFWVTTHPQLDCERDSKGFVTAQPLNL